MVEICEKKMDTLFNKMCHRVSRLPNVWLHCFNFEFYLKSYTWNCTGFNSLRQHPGRTRTISLLVRCCFSSTKLVMNCACINESSCTIWSGCISNWKESFIFALCKRNSKSLKSQCKMHRQQQPLQYWTIQRCRWWSAVEVNACAFHSSYAVQKTRKRDLVLTGPFCVLISLFFTAFAVVQQDLFNSFFFTLPSSLPSWQSLLVHAISWPFVNVKTQKKRKKNSA